MNCVCVYTLAQEIWVRYDTGTPDQLVEDNMLGCGVNYLAPVLTVPVTEANSDLSSNTAQQQKMIDGKTEAEESGDSGQSSIALESIAWHLWKKTSFFILLTPWSNRQYE